MIVKEKILKDVKSMESPKMLNQLFGYLRLVKNTDTITGTNRNAVLQFAGTLSKADALRINQSIYNTFNQIEGEW
jgi:hypothetical protein